MGGNARGAPRNQVPGRFGTVAALAPGNLLPEMVDWKLYSPLYERILGKGYARKMGEHDWRDILDTTDMIYSKDAPLLPSIKRDEAGKMVGAGQVARELAASST